MTIFQVNRIMFPETSLKGRGICGKSLLSFYFFMEPMKQKFLDGDIFVYRMVFWEAFFERSFFIRSIYINTKAGKKEGSQGYPEIRTIIIWLPGKQYLQKALKVTREPRIVFWSCLRQKKHLSNHIHLITTQRAHWQSNEVFLGYHRKTCTCKASFAICSMSLLMEVSSSDSISLRNWKESPLRRTRHV